jgi:HEPN domain-containing protein
MKPEATDEGRRWLLQAQQDLDERYPNGLPGGIPAEAFEKRDADRAIEIAEEVIKVIEKKISI